MLMDLKRRKGYDIKGRLCTLEQMINVMMKKSQHSINKTSLTTIEHM